MASPDLERLAHPESHHYFLHHGTCDIANQICFLYFLLLLLFCTRVQNAICFVAAPASTSAQKSALKCVAVEACKTGCDGLKAR